VLLLVKKERLKAMYKKKRTLFFTIILIALLLVDGILLWYTFAFTTDEKKVAVESVPFDMVDVQRTSGNVLLLVAQGGVMAYSGGDFTPYEAGDNASDASMGYYTGAVAISTEGGVLHYFRPGEYSPSFSISLDGEIHVIGISETAQRDLYVPEKVIVVTSNATGTHVLVLSIAGRGTVDWSYDLTSQVVAVSRSYYARSFLVGLDNNTVYLFKLIQTTPRTIYHLPGPVREVQLAPSGLTLGILYGDDPAHLAMYGYSSSTPVSVTDLPGNCKNLQLQKEGSFAYLERGDDVMQVLDGNSSLKTSVEGLHSYVVPSVTDIVFVSTHGKIMSYKGYRGAPIWEAKVGDMTANLITDAAGYVLVGWNGTSLVVIDNSQPVTGSRTMLLAVGVVVILESTALPVVAWRKRLSKVDMKTLYVLLAGIMVGIVVSTALPDPGFTDALGGLPIYLLVVTIISAMSTVIAWESQAGVASVVIGFAAGLVISIPICLVASFFMWAVGVDFSSSDFLFSLVANGLALGFKVGIAGGLAGYLLRWIFV